MQEIYLKKRSWERLVGEGENKAGQDWRGAEQGGSADLAKALQKVVGPTPQSTSEMPQRVSGRSADGVVHARPETEVSPSARLGNENRPDPVSCTFTEFASLTCTQACRGE